MDLFEKAKLKGQKLNLASLLSKPEFRQQYLAPIRCLEADDQCMLLNRVIKCEISLSELKSEATHLKQLMSLKAAFLRLTNTESWSEAQEKFPQFAMENQLRKFAHLDLKKSIPTSFTDFCTRAKASETTNEIPPESVVYSFESVKANVVESSISTVTGHLLKKSDPNFCGAHLSIIKIEEVPRCVFLSAMILYVLHVHLVCSNTYSYCQLFLLFTMVSRIVKRAYFVITYMIVLT